MGKTDVFAVLDDLKKRMALGMGEAICALDNREKCWLFHKHSEKSPVTLDQITSLTAMIVYVAHKKNVLEFQIERQVINQFCVPNIKCLAEQDYFKALKYLTYLLPQETKRA